LALNNVIIKNEALINDIKSSNGIITMQMNRQINNANVDIFSAQQAIILISNIAENVLSVMALFLLMYIYSKNYKTYIETFLNHYNGLIAELADDSNSDNNVLLVNKCFSLMPTEFEVEKIRTFFVATLKKTPQWDEKLADLFTDFLSLKVNKDYSIKPSKFKLTIDSGAPQLLSQEKDTTVSFNSLKNYAQIIDSLNDNFKTLNAIYQIS
jgi:hypothetical protein